MKEVELDWYMGYPVQKIVSEDQDESIASEKSLLNLSTPS
jgi:hypothetical protein